MLTRLFPNKRPDALELVLHVCRGDVIMAIEHLLSGQEDSKRGNDPHANRKRHASQERTLRVCFNGKKFSKIILCSIRHPNVRHRSFHQHLYQRHVNHHSASMNCSRPMRFQVCAFFLFLQSKMLLQARFNVLRFFLRFFTRLSRRQRLTLI